MDFSIHISNTTPADASTYYSVKFWKLFKSGPGTRLIVSGEYSVGILHILVYNKSIRTPSIL